MTKPRRRMLRDVPKPRDIEVQELADYVHASVETTDYAGWGIHVDTPLRNSATTRRADAVTVRRVIARAIEALREELKRRGL